MTAAKRFVYILNSTADPSRYYTGITSNVRVRLGEHNRGACLHTRRWTPWRVIVVVAFASEKPALDFERYLKTGSGCAFARPRLTAARTSEGDTPSPTPKRLRASATIT